jgi:hypothetical protein
MTLRLEPLNRSHRLLLAGFQNPQASLVEYLKRYALRHAEKDLLAQTYLALDSGVGSPISLMLMMVMAIRDAGTA